MKGLIGEDTNSIVKYVITLVLVLLAFVGLVNAPKKKNKYSVSPRVTLKCRFINVMLWPYHKFQLRKEFLPLELSELKRFAVEKTGLDDFAEGDRGEKCFYMIAFEFIIQLANQACYSPLGYAAFQDFLKRLLVTRLRIHHELKEDSMKEYCDKNPIRKPIFILGLPRTGTTFLHRLLSLDPANTAPLTWELTDPVPRLKDDLDTDMKKRIEYCQRNIDMLLSLNPHFADIHELGADIPEECTLLMGVDGPALMFNFHTLLDVQETFYGWNWSEAYRNYYKALQIIKHYRDLRTGIQDTKRWVLKSPPHLGGIFHLVKEFPDARIIWTHRDPKECLPSLASLIRAGMDVSEGGGIIQLDRLGQQMVTYADLMYHNGDKFFSEVRDEPKFCSANVFYDSLISDPIRTISSLYDDFGYDFTDKYKRNIEEYLVNDKKKRDSLKGQSKSVHKYSLEEYGLTDAEIDKKFAWYCEKYLPSE